MIYSSKVYLFNEFHFYFLLYLRKEKKKKRRISIGNKMKVCEPAKKKHTHTHMHIHEVIKEKSQHQKYNRQYLCHRFSFFKHTCTDENLFVNNLLLHFSLYIYIFLWMCPNKYIATKRKEKKTISVYINMCVCKSFSKIDLLSTTTWIYINDVKRKMTK